MGTWGGLGHEVNARRKTPQAVAPIRARLRRDSRVKRRLFAALGVAGAAGALCGGLLGRLGGLVGLFRAGRPGGLGTLLRCGPGNLIRAFRLLGLLLAHRLDAAAAGATGSVGEGFLLRALSFAS